MKKHLKALAKWSYVLGIIGMLFGAFVALMGIPLFYVGAVPGLLIVILNIRLLQASRSAKRLNYNLRLMKNDDDIYDETMKKFSSYFRMQFWVVFFILIIVIGVGAGMVAVPMDYLTLIQEQFMRTVPFI